MSQSLKFAYFGTPEFSTFVLEELKLAGLVPTLVVTTPDRPKGRGLQLAASPVRAWAAREHVHCIQPTEFSDHVLAEIKKMHSEVAVVAAYGKILPIAVLDLFPKGGLNVHPSLLPRYRGASPIESQILADEKEIGVTVILMDEKVDHGPIVAQQHFPHISVLAGRKELNDLLWHEGGKLLADALPRWVAGEILPRHQNELFASMTKKISKEDGELDLKGHPRKNYLKYLAYEGWPGVYFFEGDVRVKITKASYEHDRFVIESVIPEGKAEMSYEAFAKRKS